MNRHSKEFKELVARLQSGELTRRQAAEQYKLSLNTLESWLRRAKVNESTRLKVKPLYGQASLTPDIAKALQEATDKVLSGEIRSCLAAMKTYPNISLSTLSVRVRKARLAAGIPLKRKTKDKEPSMGDLSRP